MEKFIVTGEVQLKGCVQVSGAKNATLPIMAATLLSNGLSVLHDVPELRDITMMQNIMSLLGASIIREGHTSNGYSRIIDAGNACVSVFDGPLVGTVSQRSVVLSRRLCHWSASN
jgi:UDP-N-acetylglucosamine enolpyruvyl transferase